MDIVPSDKTLFHLEDSISSISCQLFLRYGTTIPAFFYESGLTLQIIHLTNRRTNDILLSETVFCQMEQRRYPDT